MLLLPAWIWAIWVPHQLSFSPPPCPCVHPHCTVKFLAVPRSYAMLSLRIVKLRQIVLQKKKSFDLDRSSLPSSWYGNDNWWKESQEIVMSNQVTGKTKHRQFYDPIKREINCKKNTINRIKQLKKTECKIKLEIFSPIYIFQYL